MKNAARKALEEHISWMFTVNEGAGAFKAGWDDALRGVLAYIAKADLSECCEAEAPSESERLVETGGLA